MTFPTNLTNSACLVVLIAITACDTRTTLDVLSSSKGSRDHALKYLLVRRNAGTVDTIFTTILTHDSTESGIRLKYHFDSGDTSRADYDQEFVLPIKLDSTGIDNISLVHIQKLEFEGQEYPIYKYQFDEPNSEDEESLFFYTPRFGIILFHWGTFRNSQRLIDVGTVKQNQAIYYLTDMIENDHTLTKSW